MKDVWLKPIYPFFLSFRFLNVTLSSASPTWYRMSVSNVAQISAENLGRFSCHPAMLI